MQESLKRYALNLVLWTFCLIAGGLGIFHFLLPGAYFQFFPLVPVIMAAVIYIVHLYMVRDSDGDPKKFTAKYLGAMGVKILIYLIFLVIFLAISNENAIAFLISFLGCYACFTLVEVIAILKLQKDYK